MNKLIILITLVILTNISYASSSSVKFGNVNVIEPYNTTLYNNSTVFLGDVAPGQTFFINISSNTTGKNGEFVNMGWSHFIAYGLPKGWIVDNSSYNSQILSIQIRAAPNASYKAYNFTLKAITFGNLSNLGEPVIHAGINVSNNVFNLNIPNSEIKVYPNKLGFVKVIINNTGVSDNPFIISSSGLPGWNFSESVISLHGKESEFEYPVEVHTVGSYSIRLNVRSSTSKEVEKSKGIKVVTINNLLTDYGSFGSGFLVFPATYEPINAVLYLIDRLIRLI